MNTAKLRNTLIVYLAVNFTYMLPCAILFFLSRGDPPFIPKFILSIYVVSMLLFYLFKLTYAHIFLCAVFLPLNIRQFAKDKNAVLFIVSLLITAVDIAVNIYWEKTGFWITRQ